MSRFTSQITHYADGREMDPWTKMALEDVVEDRAARVDPYRVTPEHLAQRAIERRDLRQPNVKLLDMELHGCTEEDVLAFFREWHEQAAPRDPQSLRQKARRIEGANERFEAEIRSGEPRTDDAQELRETIRENRAFIRELLREADEKEQMRD